MWLSCLCLPALLVCLFVFHSLCTTKSASKLRGLSWSFYFHDEWWCPSSVCASKSSAKLEFSLCLKYFSSVLASFRLFKHASPVSLIVEAVSVTQSYLTLRDPMDYRLPDSSVHCLLQARKWSGLGRSRRSSQPRDRTWVFCILGRFFTIWARKHFSWVWKDKFLLWWLMLQLFNEI